MKLKDYIEKELRDAELLNKYAGAKYVRQKIDNKIVCKFPFEYKNGQKHIDFLFGGEPGVKTILCLPGRQACLLMNFPVEPDKIYVNNEYEIVKIPTYCYIQETSIQTVLNEIEPILDIIHKIVSIQNNNIARMIQKADLTQKISNIKQTTTNLQTQIYNLQNQINSFNFSNTIKPLNSKQKAHILQKIWGNNDNDSVNILNAIKQQGFDPHYVHKNNQSLLMLAINKNDINLFDLLISNKLDFNNLIAGKSFLQLILTTNSNALINKMLNSSQDFSKSVLNIALNNDAIMLGKIFSYKPALSKTLYSGYSLLQLALKNSSLNAAEQILRSSPDTIIQLSPKGLSPLQLCLLLNNGQAVTLLRKYSANIELEFKNAIDKNYNKIIGKICELASDVIDKPTNEGKSWLYYILMQNKTSIAEILLNKSANIKIVIREAVAENNTKIIEDLIVLSSTNTQVQIEQNILHVALEQIHANIKRAEEIMKERQALIQEIFKLIAEGDARIQEKSEKGMLILGKTGAGKTTLTYLLANQDLKAVENNKGDLQIEAVIPHGNIKIGHTTISETTIPNKYKVGDTTIWDCPGFMDTAGIAQEIANAFYIQRLFETTKQLKFILVIPEALLKSKTDMLPIVEQFTNGFNNIQALKNSVSLVITKAAPHKQPSHIKTAINELIEQNSNNISPKTLEVLKILLQSIHIFHSPIKVGAIEKSTLLEEINNSINYVDLLTYPNLANIVISKESTEYAKELLATNHINLNKLVDIFVSAIEQADKYLTNTNNNIFVKSYDTIKSWLPSSVEYADINRLPQHTTTEYFLKLEQLKAFQNLFTALSNNQNLNNQNFEISKYIFLKALEIFEEFTKNDKLKQQIQEYAHIFKQQIEYIKFLSQVCDNKPVDYSYIEKNIQKCKAYINTALEQSIKSIKLADGKVDIAYYQKAIGYLDQYKNDQGCSKVKADAYNNIGRIYNNQGNYSQAALNYTKALELNKELPKTYEKLGEILFNNKQYLEAIKCFKVVDNSIKIENCFKELVKAKPNDSNIRIDKGDYYFSIGRYDKAIGCYKDAFSLSEDTKFKLAANQKIAMLLEQQIKKMAELANSIKKAELYHYNEVNTNELTLAISQIAINDNHEVDSVGNISNSYS